VVHPDPLPTLALPPRPEERRPATPSPLVVVAPLAGSLVLWAITGSALSLAFAALAPLLLLAGVVDGRWRARRDRRRDARRYAERLAELEAEIGDAHRLERDAATRTLPTAREWFTGAAGARWRTAPAEPLLVTIGRANVPSRLRLTPDRTGAEPPAVDRVRARARVLPDGPVAVDLRRGLCIAGPGAAADALLRSVLLQALCRVGPAARVESTGGIEPWLAALPHPVRAGSGQGAVRIVLADGGPPATLARAAGPEAAPADCDAIVAVGAGGARVLRHPELPPGAPFNPDAVSSVEARQLARDLAAAADSREGRLPDRVALGPLLTGAVAGNPAPGSLRCPIGVGPTGAVEVDLVSDGPHAVLGGTTGSGKSELLRSWVLALAALHPPSAVQFLLLDFKGGAAFTDLEVLPHTLAVLTDLDPPAVRRAVASIRAELTRRERVLAAAGKRSVDAAGGSGLARLVLVVDEFAALAERVPECHAVLTDVAARGRSLGVHLILGTQRPAGVVRDALLANAGLRICLRVTSEDDSRAVVGGPDAAALERPGRGILAPSGAPRVLVQIAEAEPELAAMVAGSWPEIESTASARRPWLPELPERIAPEDLPAGDGLVFGLADLPEQQAQPPAAWDPRRSGALLVLGAPRSGRSTALAAVAAASGAPEVIWPRPTVPCVWDAVTEALVRLDSGRAERRLLLLDDIDAVLAAAGGEYAHELADRVLRLLRDGSGTLAVVLAAARVPSQLGAGTALAGSRLLLRAASRDEHLLAGGAADRFDRTAPPGRGELDGTLVQLAFARRRPEPPAERAEPLRPLPGLLAVSARPASLEATLGAAAVLRLPRVEPSAAAVRVLVGTPDEWQSRWSAFRQLAAAQPVLFDGCSPADVRSLLGRHELPPPCSGAPRWLFRPGEPAIRVRVGGGV
jgi:DNA segregation ATPase FtsK/SpoIIIE, S-DNA-T family